MLEARLAGNAGALRVRQDGADDNLRVILLPQDLRATKRMIVEARPSLVIEVVQQADDPPQGLIFTEQAGIPADRGLDRQRVLSQVLTLRVLGQQFPGCVAG